MLKPPTLATIQQVKLQRGHTVEQIAQIIGYSASWFYKVCRGEKTCCPYRWHYYIEQGYPKTFIMVNDHDSKVLREIEAPNIWSASLQALSFLDDGTIGTVSVNNETAFFNQGQDDIDLFEVAT